MISWLMGDSYYSMVTATNSDTELLFARIGANDPDFNLRNEPAFIIRDSNSNQLFASVFEQHGHFDESLEQSEQARTAVSHVQVLHQSTDANIVEIHESSLGRCLICHWKGNTAHGQHDIVINGETISWHGSVAVLTSTGVHTQ